MNEIVVKSANELWTKLTKIFNDPRATVLQKSRAGDNKELLHQWIRLTDPSQRFMSTRSPSINPAFAIAEIIWIVNGRNDSLFLNKWNSQLCKYAGYDNHYHGAYGFRLRRNYNIDQLRTAYLALIKNPTSRQIVLQIWDPQKDLPTLTGKPKNKDIPCNVSSLLKIRDDKLEWVQIMRSNDVFRGLPYNIIQFTSLQEILAGWIGVSPGNYYHFSDSLHLYLTDSQYMHKYNRQKNAVNNDSLQVPYKDSIKYFKQLEHKIELIINNDITPKKLISINKWDSAPDSFKNMLSLIVAEAARKLKYNELVTEIMHACTNQCYKQLWNNWNAERIR
jgi:thymidylate synthase